MKRRLPSLLLLLLLTAATPGFGALIIINTLPFKAVKPGDYALVRSLNYAGANQALEIAADDVTIDLRGHAITAVGAAADPGTTVLGIHALAHSNITIRNGMVRGFYRGIFLEPGTGAGGHLLEDLRAEKCTYLGLQVHGGNCIIRRCRVNEIGGSTVNVNFRYGIYASGSNMRIVDNEVHKIGADTNTGAYTYGIAITGAGDSTIERNRLLGSLETKNSIYDFGILVDNSVNVLLTENQISRQGVGIIFRGTTAAKYRDNLVIDALTPFQNNATPATNVTDAGGND